MKNIFAAIAVASLTACGTVPTQWVATGGSKADGVVRLSYEIGELQTAALDESQAMQVAAARCKVWGYQAAEAFGGTRRACNMPGGFSGCRQWMVTKEYQCTGGSVPANG